MKEETTALQHEYRIRTYLPKKKKFWLRPEFSPSDGYKNPLKPGDDGITPHCLTFITSHTYSRPSQCPSPSLPASSPSTPPTPSISTLSLSLKCLCNSSISYFYPSLIPENSHPAPSPALPYLQTFALKLYLDGTAERCCVTPPFFGTAPPSHSVF